MVCRKLDVVKSKGAAGMNELLGQVFTGLIIDENDMMYLVQKKWGNVPFFEDSGYLL